MKRTPEQLPDPWLFDSEALLKQLDRCRELVLRIPITDTQDIHFGINIAVDVIVLQKEQFGFFLMILTAMVNTYPPAHTRSKARRQQPHAETTRLFCLLQSKRASVSRKTVDSGAPISARAYRPAAQNLIRSVAQVAARKTRLRSLERCKRERPGPAQE